MFVIRLGISTLLKCFSSYESDLLRCVSWQKYLAQFVFEVYTTLVRSNIIHNGTSRDVITILTFKRNSMDILISIILGE